MRDKNCLFAFPTAAKSNNPNGWVRVANTNAPTNDDAPDNGLGIHPHQYHSKQSPNLYATDPNRDELHHTMGHTTALPQPSAHQLPKLINASPSLVPLSTVSSTAAAVRSTSTSSSACTDAHHNGFRCKIRNNNVTDTQRGDVHECAGCCKLITERFLLKALDLYWHEDCLKCGCCDCRLGEVGSTLYTKANLILCKRDYLR